MDAVHFHCQYKKFTRAKGQSAVQAAAYRLAARLSDDRTGLLHNYTRKSGVTGILTATPAGIAVPPWARDPARLWNEVEASEKTNPRALVMHEWEIAMPHMLTPDQRKAAAQEMAQFIADRYGCVAMAAFHKPGRAGDQRNHHIHLMFTPRAIGSTGFVKSKFRNYSLRAAEAEAAGRMTGAGEIVFIRSQWAAIGNRHLERAGLAPSLDHRSYEEQGIDLEPQKHLGPDAIAKERRGERTAKGDFNRAVRDRNRNRQEWARAWRETRISITAPSSDPSPALSENQSPPPPAISRGFRTLMENQTVERTALLNLHISENTNLWRDEQESRRAHKKQWARLYRQQREDRDALLKSMGGWKRRLLRTLDLTGRLRKEHKQAIAELEQRHNVVRARVGLEQRSILREVRIRLHVRQERELLELDARHMEQRRELLQREIRNRELLERLPAQTRNRGRDQDPSRGP